MLDNKVSTHVQHLTANSSNSNKQQQYRVFLVYRDYCMAYLFVLFFMVIYIAPLQGALRLNTNSRTLLTVAFHQTAIWS